MINLHSYDIERKKKTVTLGSGWRFIADTAGFSHGEAMAEMNKSGVSVTIPSAWNYTDNLFDYEGVGWYSCNFNAEEGRHKLVFEGVCNDAEVWVDGKMITEHHGAFLGFATYLDFDEYANHTLAVRVSNITNTENTIPSAECDWKRYGGIIRPVNLTKLPTKYIDGMQVTYTLSNDLKSAKVRTRVEFYGKVPTHYDLLINGKKLSVA